MTPGHMRTCLLTVLLLALAFAGAVRGAETARQILDRRKALDDTTRHWNDRHQKMKLTIVDRRGGERVRELDLFDRREPGDEQKTILFFLAPAEVKGTGFLAFTHKGRPADQWLYLPELQRSSLRGEETVDGTPTYAIELVPRREDIGYRKLVLWLGREDLLPHRLEFYEDGSEPRKRMTQGDVRSIGAIPVAHHIEVATPAAGSHTVIEIADVQFNQKLDPELFSQRYLERGGR